MIGQILLFTLESCSIGLEVVEFFTEPEITYLHYEVLAFESRS